MGRNKSRKPEIPLKSKLKKDPGVPRLPDLRLRNAEKQKQKELAHQPRSKDPDSEMAAEPTLSSLALLAASTETIPDDTISEASTSYGGSVQKTKEQLRRHYIRALHKVIDESDIIMLVLDARDPEGCRSRLVEEEVRRREHEGKKLVFVLNKIDLIPKENAQLWLRHLRHSTPTLPFRSASNTQRNNLSSATAPALLKLLKAYKPSPAQSVTVGVVGYPNVGKSSLINSLKRSKVCAVAAQAGHTKELQSVQLERGIRVIDSPGVIFDDDDESADIKGGKKGSVLLRNVVKVADVEDPIAVVEEILYRTEHEKLQSIYNLPQFTSTLEFLTMLALSSGRLLKGGTPDVLAAARQVLGDWNAQKIPYHSIPPAIHPSSIPSQVVLPGASNSEVVVAPGAENVGQAQILSTLGPAFNLGDLFGAADAGAFGGENGDAMEADVEDDGAELMDEDGIQMESDDLAPAIPRKRSRAPSPAASVFTDDSRIQRMPKRLRRNKDVPAYDVAEKAAQALLANPLSRRALKKDAKKARRDAQRASRAQRGGMEVDDGLEGMGLLA